MSSATPRWAVVSVHVERLLDDRVWERYIALVRRRPGGFPIASLVRPPAPSAGESEERWLERAHELAAYGPFGHHTHWTAPDHARPTGTADTGDRVLREGAWLRAHGLAPTLFCGGGWYTDTEVAAACATLGYVDCTPRATRPPHLAAGAVWAELGAPARLATASGPMLAIPTTHSLGDIARAVVRPARLPAPVVHAYCHDTDLLDARRRQAFGIALALLARRRAVTDLDALAVAAGASAQTVPWSETVRGEPSGGPQ